MEFYHEEPQKPPSPTRPGCLTAYIILIWLGTALYSLAILGTGLGMMMEPEVGSVVGLFVIACLGIFILIPILTSIGLWQMKKWAWWVVVVFLSLRVIAVLFGLCLVLLALASEISPGEAVSFVAGLFVNGLINGGILYWFIQNRHLFEAAAKTEIGLDGKVIKKSSSTGDALAVGTIIGLVALACLLPFVVVVILTLLGPQIGNVFSRIVFELSTPIP